jgi:hypothetical protein
VRALAAGIILAALLAPAARADEANPLLEVIDRLSREANFRNAEVNDGRPELNLQMPLRATRYPGLCAQDNLRIRDPGSPSVTLKDIETTTTFRAVGDPKPSAGAGSGYWQKLDAECRKYEIASERAPDAFSAWAAAYAVALVRDELKKPESGLLEFSCVDSNTSCGEPTILLQFIKPDAIVRASVADCPGGAGRCVRAGGFYDAYAAKVREKVVFVSVLARFDRDPSGGVGAFRGATLSEELVESDDG